MSETELTLRERNRIAVRKYQAKNREKLREQSKAYRKANPEYFKQKKAEEMERIRTDPDYRKATSETRKRYYLKNQEKMVAAATDYAKRNVEKLKDYRKRAAPMRAATARKWRLANPEHYKEVQARWRKNNKHIIRKHIALRRAREINATIGNPKEIALWEKEWRTKETATCEWCRGEFSVKQCETDHVHPLILGGAHCLSNLVVACKTCNSRKRGKPIEKWLAELGATDEDLNAEAAS